MHNVHGPALPVPPMALDARYMRDFGDALPVAGSTVVIKAV